MITFGLVLLFIFSAIAVAISLSDSALRGARVFKQLSRAAKVEEMEYRELVRVSVTPIPAVHKSPSVRQARKAPRANFSTSSPLLPVAA